MTELAARKKALLLQLASHHAVLRNILNHWHAPVTTVGKSLKILRYLRHPLVLTGLTLVATVGQRGLGAWARRGWLMWKTVRALKRKS